jgi:hypothetical protein
VVPLAASACLSILRGSAVLRDSVRYGRGVVKAQHGAHSAQRVATFRQSVGNNEQVLINSTRESMAQYTGYRRGTSPIADGMGVDGTLLFPCFLAD